MINEQDKALLEKKGISETHLKRQLECFKKGFPYLKLVATASVQRGILCPDANERIDYVKVWDNYVSDPNKKVVKFVPASGAASRMFKDIFTFVDGNSEVPVTDFEKKFFDNIHDAAYFQDLDAACLQLCGCGVDRLLEDKRYKDVAKVLLSAEGMGYGHLPKGLLKFHSYNEGARTPMEEHLVEGAMYAKQGDGEVNVHFTVSPEHRKLFEKLLAEKVTSYEHIYGVSFNVDFSEQKASTDTIAVNPDNTLFRQNDNSLLFRPGGHGALIENLNDIDADIIFVKNIDNVVPDRLKPEMVNYKKLLGGVLIVLQQQAFAYLRKLDSGHYKMSDLLEMLQFVQKKLCCKNPETKLLEDTEMAIYLRRKLNRPMRVCGMVRNVGEPGGGPFLAYNQDGTISLQILESSQIDMSNVDAKTMFESGTHFNPVDLVCGVKDYLGQAFALTDFVDSQTGFISNKSKDGKDLKALELPGLWNGAMSDWNTVFVEVPLSTFNPVKTVNDLYREQHQ